MYVGREAGGSGARSRRGFFVDQTCERARGDGSVIIPGLGLFILMPVHAVLTLGASVSDYIVSFRSLARHFCSISFFTSATYRRRPGVICCNFHVRIIMSTKAHSICSR